MHFLPTARAGALCPATCCLNSPGELRKPHYLGWGTPGAVPTRAASGRAPAWPLPGAGTNHPTPPSRGCSVHAASPELGQGTRVPGCQAQESTHRRGTGPPSIGGGGSEARAARTSAQRTLLRSTCLLRKCTGKKPCVWKLQKKPIFAINILCLTWMRACSLPREAGLVVQGRAGTKTAPGSAGTWRAGAGSGH